MNSPIDTNTPIEPIPAGTAPAPQRPTSQRPDVIALRRTCDAEGTGLSHYVLMDQQVTR